jgi:hypothetical protein
MTDFVIAVNEAEKAKNKAENNANQREETEWNSVSSSFMTVKFLRLKITYYI